MPRAVVVAVAVAGAVAGSTVAAAPTPALPATAASPATSLPGGRLAGFVVGIDPGHNGMNWAYPDYMQQQVWDGREYKDCDTTGTQTDAGYPEHRFAWQVAKRLRRMLRTDGATVVLTRPDDDGHGPCVDRRARILNRADSDVAVDIHADGGPSSGRGFAILEPVRTRENRQVVKPSARFGRYLRHAMLVHTTMPTSTYDGTDGIAKRDDLAGLNLARQPKVLIECGNMRNATDARKLSAAAFRRHLARAMEAAIIRFLA